MGKRTGRFLPYTRFCLITSEIGNYMKAIRKYTSLALCLPVVFFCITFVASAADVSLYAVYKRQVFLQTGLNAPVPHNPVCVFNMVVEMTASNSVAAATLSVHTNPPVAMARWHENE